MEIKMKRYQVIENCTNGLQDWWEETNRYYESLESAKRYCREHETFVRDGIYDKEKDVSYYFADGKWKKEYGWMF